MKNTKELQTIFSVLFYYNRLSDNENTDIRELIEYAFDRIFNHNTSMLMLACLGRTLEDSREELNQILKQDTKFFEYKQRREEIRRNDND